MAAQLTAKTLGADADRVQDWFRSPEKMIQLIAAAEGAHGGSGPERARELAQAQGREARTTTGREAATREQACWRRIRRGRT